MQQYLIEPDAIDRFEGRFAFLSNFYEVPGKAHWDGMTASTTEHLFQTAKCVHADDRDLVLAAPSPTLAKRLGRKVPMRADWDDVRIDVMRSILAAKFSNQSLQEALLATGNRQLVEGNWWGDRFWGVDAKTRIGCNRLGELLMELRKSLRG